MNAQIIIQARYNSTRLPGKALLPFGASTVVGHLLNTCRSLKHDKINFTTTLAVPERDALHFRKFPEAMSIDCDENNLTERYKIALSSDADVIIRLTSDCPLIVDELIVQAAEALLNDESKTYVTSATPFMRTLPDGLDIQAIRRDAFLEYVSLYPNEEHIFQKLEIEVMKAFVEIANESWPKDKAFPYAILRPDERHYLIANPFSPNNKLSIDTEEDYERCKCVYERLIRARHESLGSKKPGDKQQEG